MTRLTLRILAEPDAPAQDMVIAMLPDLCLCPDGLECESFVLSILAEHMVDMSAKTLFKALDTLGEITLSSLHHGLMEGGLRAMPRPEIFEADLRPDITFDFPEREIRIARGSSLPFSAFRNIRDDWCDRTREAGFRSRPDDPLVPQRGIATPRADEIARSGSAVLLGLFEAHLPLPAAAVSGTLAGCLGIVIAAEGQKSGTDRLLMRSPSGAYTHLYKLFRMLCHEGALVADHPFRATRVSRGPRFEQFRAHAAPHPMGIGAAARGLTELHEQAGGQGLYDLVQDYYELDDALRRGPAPVLSAHDRLRLEKAISPIRAALPQSS